jgi:hypothetical protein
MSERLMFSVAEARALETELTRLRSAVRDLIEAGEGLRNRDATYEPEDKAWDAVVKNATMHG